MPEHTLILLRHAKSDWSGHEADVDRPLAKRGRRQAPEAGRWLRRVAPIDLALVSPARRAKSTWALAGAELGYLPPHRLDERLYAASAADLLDVVQRLTAELHTVVVVGHNPGLEDLATMLTERFVVMPTSALAVVALSGPWSSAGPSSARLLTSGRPPSPWDPA